MTAVAEHRAHGARQPAARRLAGVIIALVGSLVVAPAAGASFVTFSGSSADGATVFFETDEQLVSADTDASKDVYARSAGTTTLVSAGQVNGNGEIAASFEASSADGTRVIFSTAEPLVAADTDVARDLYERAGGTTTLLTAGQINGNGAAAASFSGASTDATKVFFVTGEQLVAADTDAQTDIYERSGGATTLVSAGAINGNGAFIASFRGSSADASKVFFETNEQLVAVDTDASADVYQRFAGTTTKLSARVMGGNDNFHAAFAGASADGGRVFFESSEQLAAADTDASRDVFERSGGATSLVSAGEINGNGAFGASFAGASADGTRVFFISGEQLAATDLDVAANDLYERSGGTTTQVSVGQINGNDGGFSASFDGASADGTRVFFSTGEQLVAGDTDGSQTDVYQRSGGGTTLVSAGEINGNGVFGAVFAGASADGTRVFFQSSEKLVAADTDSSIDLYERAASTTTLVSAGQINGNGAFNSIFDGASADGTRVFFSTDERLSQLDTDSDPDAYERSGGTTKLLAVEAFPPETTITSPPPGTDAVATFSFTSSEPGSSFECSLDGAAFAGCASPTAVGPLPAGPHAFSVRAIDLAGNVDPTPAAQQFTVADPPPGGGDPNPPGGGDPDLPEAADREPPETTIDKAPKRASTKRKAKFTFSASEAGSTFECKLDQGRFAPCKPRSTFKVKPAKHKLQVRATDVAGNVDPTPAKARWKVKQRRS